MKDLWREYKYHFLIATAIILSLTSPILLTKFSLWVTFNENDSHIGDTIGGITAPFFNIIGSLLIFFTFNEQLKEKKENNIKNNCLLFLTHLKETINNYSFSSFFGQTEETKQFGYDALNSFFVNLQITHSDIDSLSNEIEVIEVEYILKFLNSTYEIIETLDAHNKIHFYNYLNTIVAPISIFKSIHEFNSIKNKTQVPPKFIENLIKTQNFISKIS